MFFFLPALFFATAILNLNFLARLPMTSTFFRGLSGSNLSAFLYFDSGFVSKKMMMKWMVVLLLFLFGCHKQIVLPTSSSTDVLLSVLPLFSWIHRASLGLNTSFFLALIFSLMHLWSCTHLLSFLYRSYSNLYLFWLFLFWFDNDRRLNSWNT